MSTKAKAPPQPRQQPQRPVEIPDLVIGILDEVEMLKRSYAGYKVQMGSLAAIQGQVPPDGRKRGLSILSYPGTFDGRDVQQVAADLKKITPQFLPGICIPLANLHTREMYEAAKQILSNAQQLYQMIESIQPPVNAAVTAPAETPNGPPDAEEFEGEDEDA